MDIKWLRGLIELVETSGVDSLDLELVASENGDPTRVRIRKSPRVSVAAAPAFAPPVASVPEGPVAAPAPAGAVVTGTEGSSADEPDSPTASEPDPVALHEVTSPMIGTFYRSEGPGKPPFVSPGDRISVGQVLCILEAMKLMNELTSEVDGIVREVLVENEDPVEFGMPLFRIETD